MNGMQWLLLFSDILIVWLSVICFLWNRRYERAVKEYREYIAKLKGEAK
jgi:hypothetical protein